MITPTPHLDGPPHLHMAPAVFPDDFDPDSVPRYPVVVLEVSADTDPTADGYTVRLNGQTVPVPAEPPAEEPNHLEHAFDAAVSAAARFIAQRGWTAARVNAVGPDGQRWPMIIGPRSERYDLTTPPRAARRPRWLLPAVAALVAVAAALAAVGIALRPTASSVAGTPPAAPPPTAQPAELPVLPPAGYTTHARWAYGPIAEAQSLAVGPTGILIRAQDQLVLLDPETGQSRWSTEIPSSTSGPWSATIDNVAAVVTVANNTLTWRSWLALEQAHTVSLPENSSTTMLPGGLLITLPDQRAQLLTATGTTDRLIPAGAVPVGIQGSILWASNGRQLWQLDHDAPQTPTPIALRPPATGAQPTTGTPVWKSGRLLTTWTTAAADSKPGRTYAALHDSRGRLVKAFPVTDASPAPDHLGSARYTALNGGSVVDHQAAKVMTLPENWQTTALIEDQVFGVTGDHAARYTLTTGALITGDTTSEATPVGLTGNDVLAVADLSTGPSLYRLPSR